MNYTYDKIGQLKVADSATATEDRGYTYDAAWNLAYRTNNTTLNTFTVDGKNQLTSSTPGGVSTYDANGNLTCTGSGAYVFAYDDENQLISVTTNNVATGWTGRQVLYAYDGLGRLRLRVERYNQVASPPPDPQASGFAFGGVQVQSNPALSWATNSVTRYIYDGWRVIQERDVNNTPVVSYTRGTELSGSLEGAGGIGGLLARSHGYSGGNWSTHNFYHADGNGNVTYMVNSSQTRSASYRYDPYGNAISASELSGLGGIPNTYRFSSKMFDPVAGFYYYGYRWYAPSLQRWPNRDPLGDIGSLAHLSAQFEPFTESSVDVSAAVGPFEVWGGANLYGYVENNPINFIDPFGLTSIHAQVGVAIAKGDVAALEALLGTGQLSAAQTAMVQAALSKYRSTAVQWIAKNCKGTIAREFPSEFYNTTLGTIRQLAQQGSKAAQKAWKLLNKGEYKK